MNLTETNSIARFGAFIGVIVVFTISLNAWDGTSPQLSGWSALESSIAIDPFDPGLTNPFPTLNMPQVPDTGCDWWDFGCYAGAVYDSVIYIGGLIFEFLSYVARLIFWFVYEMVLFFSAIFGAASLTFTGIPAWLQALLYVFSIPMLILIIWSIIRLVRGDEG